MGYIKHHAIVVTGDEWDAPMRSPDIRDAHQMATQLQLVVTPIVAGPMNATASFLVAPDGSKEGWDTSDLFDDRREQFIDWLRENPGWFEWAEVVLGPDDCAAFITRHAWQETADETQGTISAPSSVSGSGASDER